MPRQATEQAGLHDVRYCSCSLGNKQWWILLPRSNSRKTIAIENKNSATPIDKEPVPLWWNATCQLLFSDGVTSNFVLPAIYVKQGHFSMANVANISVSHKRLQTSHTLHTWSPFKWDLDGLYWPSKYFPVESFNL